VAGSYGPSLISRNAHPALHGTTLRGLVGQAVGVRADGVPGKHPAALIEEQHIHATTYEQRQLGAAGVAVWPEVGISPGHHQETLHGILRRCVDVVVCAGARARRGPGGELIEQRTWHELQHSGRLLSMGLMQVRQERRE